MTYHLAINDIEPDHWVAWVLELHGCFAKGKTKEKAVALAPDAIQKYFLWRKKHDALFVIPKEPIETETAEAVRSFAVEDYFVNALFEHDKRPLTAGDLQEIGEILSYTRKDLQEVFSGLSVEQLNRPIEGEVTGSIAGVLKHIATAEMWYFDRIGKTFPKENRPADLFALLAVSRHHTIMNLPFLMGDVTVYEKRSELWTARKVIRRTLWHEIAHTRQIERYRDKMIGTM